MACPWLNAGLALVGLVGVLVMLYPSVASWFAQYYQSLVIRDLSSSVREEPSSRLHSEISKAREYNDALTGGALLSPGSNVPEGSGTSTSALDYWSILDAGSGNMGRLRIDAIDVDLPIYHGTSDETLTKGVGHLEGTSLPVGGESQHSVLTAHRGLPSATLFDNLGELSVGDTFTIEVFGEVLTYQVIDTQTIEPEKTQALVPRYGKDLVTLVTCTPLGINSHRYLVTGERITPTPIEDVERAGQRPEIPGFPWWTVPMGAAVVAFVTVIVWSGFAKARRHSLSVARRAG
ncbi:class C sortase [Tessaracoccus aquimaris]|uniref:Class C sortase n=1 Tax=Tessaracoccus aquimaris TaxID=1332264 RepID=A0A1Q2CR30_9ACTN|nr:class C sortase [Tessaracoccus aquimaris]AQP48561.1 class C sortase [Tessaracoccus aquimaris]